MGEGEDLEVEDLPAYITRAGAQAMTPLGAPPSTGQPESTTAGPLDLETATLEEVERHLLVKALQESGGNQSEAARKLGITRRTLAYRREKYGL